MLTVEWTSAKGWLPGRIIPYQNLSLDPATCVFHYAFECFEGLKAYKVVKFTSVTYEQDKNDKTRLFRPDRNMRRFNFSAARIALPVYFILATRLKNRPSMAQSLLNSSLSLSKLTIDGFQGAKATHCIYDPLLSVPKELSASDPLLPLYYMSLLLLWDRIIPQASRPSN